MYNEINAFGQFVKRNRGVRLAFDADMQRVPSEDKARFVVEVTLDKDGCLHLRQAGASRESGLVLTGTHGTREIRIGAIVNLSETMRIQPATLRHPARSGTLEFRPKVYPGKGYVLELHWQAGQAAFGQPVKAPNPPSSPFFHSVVFNRYASKGRRIELGGGLYHLVFWSQEDAVAFGRYTLGFPRRVMPNVKSSLQTRISTTFGGYIAELTLAFPGWNNPEPGWAVETGVIVCNDSQAVALGVDVTKEGASLLPLRACSLSIRTSSETFYLLYADGSGYCRSKTGGALAPACALYFADLASADRVHAHGGSLAVSATPRLGWSPIYIEEPAVVSDGVVTLKAGSFRRGSRVADFKAA